MPWLFSWEQKELLRIHWKLSTILKTSSKSVWSNVLWYKKIYIFWKFIQYSIHWNKTQMLKKIPSDKINVTKNALFFSRELQLITDLLWIRSSYTGMVHISKTVCGIFHFRFHFYQILYFCSTNSIGSLNLKYNSYQNKNNGKVTHGFPPRPLNFMLQQEI